MIYCKALCSAVGGCKGLDKESIHFIFTFTCALAGILVQCANTLTADIFVYFV